MRCDLLLLLAACTIDTSLSDIKPETAPFSDEDTNAPPADTDTTDTSGDDGEDTAPAVDTAPPEETAPPEDTAPSDDPCAAKACPDQPTVTDQDGNEYLTVQVGSQCWIASNLRAGTYRDGARVPVAPSTSDWVANTEVGYQATYDDDVANELTLGKLYTPGVIVDSRGICPAGWRVPSSEDFDILVQGVDPYALSGESVFRGSLSADAGGALKSTTDWDSPNTGATNSTCFSGTGSGYRGSDGGYYNKGIVGYFWTTTDAFGGGFTSLLDRRMWNTTAQVAVEPNAGSLGFPVRCLRE